MLTVSLHGISIQAARGMYAQEHILYNHFEVDVDVHMPAANTNEMPFVDYTIIRTAVATAFDNGHDILEHFIRDIHAYLKERFPQSEKIRIAIRKLHPPMPGQVGYAQVVYEG